MSAFRMEIFYHRWQVIHPKDDILLTRHHDCVGTL